MGWRPSVVGRPLEVSVWWCSSLIPTAYVSLCCLLLLLLLAARLLWHCTVPLPHFMSVMSCLGLATAETKYTQHQSVTFDSNILDMYGARPGGERNRVDQAPPKGGREAARAG